VIVRASDHNDHSVQAIGLYKTCIDLLDVFYLRRMAVNQQLAAVNADKRETPHHHSPT